MRLLIVNYEYPPIGAGAASASWFLARTLAGLGHRVSVVTSAFAEHRGVSLEDGVRIHRIPAWRRRIDRSDTRQMAFFGGSGVVFAPRIVRAERIQGVIVFFTLPSGLVGYWLKARYGLPYVVSLRGGDVPGLVPELNRTHRRIRWLRRRILRSARAIVANSQGLAELSARTDPFPVSVIPNGVDSALFHPSPRASSADLAGGFQILFVGRFQNQKNLALLLDELARLRREGTAAFTLNVVGDGPLGPKMRERARRLKLDDRTVWHGWVAKPKMVELYQSADCLVNPSLYEGLPNTVLEAMACGLPVVASRVIGNDDLVTEGENGFLFELEEPWQLGSALRYLIQDPATARRMGAAGRARLLERYCWEEVAAAYLLLFEKPAAAPSS